MSRLDKRISKLEKIAKTKYNHCGVFYLLKKNDMFILQHYLDDDKEFKTREELEEYVYDKYECEKYVFFDFSGIYACLDENGKLKLDKVNELFIEDNTSTISP